jgi:hypothetical protein
MNFLRFLRHVSTGYVISVPFPVTLVTTKRATVPMNMNDSGKAAVHSIDEHIHMIDAPVQNIFCVGKCGRKKVISPIIGIATVASIAQERTQSPKL